MDKTDISLEASITKMYKEMQRHHRDFYTNVSSIADVMKTIYDSAEGTIKAFSQKNLLDQAEKKLKNIEKSLKQLYKDHEEGIDNLIKKSNVKPEDFLKVKGAVAKAQDLLKRKADENDPDRLDFINKNPQLSTNAANKQWEDSIQKRFDALVNRLNNIFGTNGDIKNILQKFTTEEAGLNKEFVKTQKVIENTEKDLIDSMAQVQRIVNYIREFGIKFFEEIDHGSALFRKNMGMMISETEEVSRKHLKLATQLTHMGASYQDVVEAEIELSKELTGIVGQSEILVNKTVQWEKQFGIANDTSARFLKTLASLKTKTSQSQTDMIGFTKAMSNAAGIPLNQVMTDIANASDDVRLFMGQTEVSLIRAAVNARMFGTTMNEIASTAKNLLNFESSITSELKASALLGRNIDFMEARRLAFNKDTKGMMEEIRRITKEIGFNDLNVIQQEAFAQATGMSVEKLQTMLQREKDIEYIRSSGTAKQKEQLKALERMQKMRETDAVNESKRAAKQLDEIANQERLLQLQEQWNQMMKTVIAPLIDKIVIPLLDVSLKILPPILRFIEKMVYPIGLILTNLAAIEGVAQLFGKHVKGLGWSFKAISTILNVTILKPFITIGTKLIDLGKILSKVSATTKAIGGNFKMMSTIAHSIFGIGANVLRFTATLGKVIPVLGWVLTIATTIFDVIRNWSKVAEAFHKGPIEGFKVLGKVILDSLLSPFKMAWEWVSSWWIGHSPSKLGLGIVKGIKSIGSLLLDALVSPFKLWYKAVTGIWKNIATFIVSMTPNWVKKMLGFSSISSSGVVNTPVPVQQPQQKTEVETKKPETKPVTDNNNYEMFVKYAQENNQILNNLSKILMNLNDLLVSGNIGINIDGTKLNNTLSNVRSNFGEYGKVSKIS